MVKRLLEIEQLAEQARRDAAQRMTDITLSLQRDSDMQLVAALVSRGAVRPCANHNREGGRMGGGVVGGGAGPTKTPPRPPLSVEALCGRE